MVEVIEALVFVGDAVARCLAKAFLRRAGDLEAQRASETFRWCVLGEVIDLEASVTCTDYGAKELDLWYSGQTYGTQAPLSLVYRITAGTGSYPSIPRYPALHSH